MADQKLYGVSYGDGNDGVSHMFADFYVRTADPYRLARAALLDRFKPEAMIQARGAAIVEGEAEYTISATILDPLGEDAPEGESWSEHNGAWMICEVFPLAEDEVREGVPIYDRIEDALTDTALKAAEDR